MYIYAIVYLVGHRDCRWTGTGIISWSVVPWRIFVRGEIG